MLECAWSVSRHTHSMEWSACCSMHSTPRNGVCHTPKMHSEWNGMPESEFNSALGTRLLKTVHLPVESTLAFKVAKK